jgi:hypothetical protein
MNFVKLDASQILYNLAIHYNPPSPRILKDGSRITESLNPTPTY